MSGTLHPDYYRILQVHAQAEQEVIEAAYRRLMRKYHPDVSSPDQRQDPRLQRKVREINAAYEVLGDKEQRAKYDETLGNRPKSQVVHLQRPTTAQAPVDQRITIEKRLYPARCSKTRQSFQILLARKMGSDGPFRVTGFAPLEESGQEFIAPTKQKGFWAKLLDKIFRRRSIHTGPIKANLPTDQELEAMFDESLVLDLGDIDWAGFTCPVCAGEYAHSDGILSTWAVCGKCSHLYCAGGIKRVRATGIVHCPWCNARRQITRHVRTGVKSHHLVRGALASTQTDSQFTDHLLSDVKDTKQLPPR